MMNSSSRKFAAVGAVLLWVSTAGFAQGSASKPSTRDIVLDQIAAPAASSGAAATQQVPARADAMAVSILVESVDGSLSPRGTDKLFRTGDRFRVKLLASRAGKVSLYNTNPQGVFNPTPIWQGTVAPGSELISARLRLEGTTGVDQLHVVLEPETTAQGVVAWLQSLLKPTAREGDASRDIKLDVDHTPTASYYLNPQSQGLQATVQIVHTR
jgi:hypothetical protein